MHCLGRTRAGSRCAAAALVVLLAVPLALPARARAQETGGLGVLQGGVPTGEATKDEIALSLTEAIERGLRYNLGSILGQAVVAGAEGARKEALADLLPQLRAGVLESRQKINLAAFGFTGALIPGVPQIVGPFNLFDARAYLQQTILDLKALNRSRASADALEAARQDEHTARDLVVLVCGQLYLQAVAGESRIAAARAQLDTAEALLGVARDRKAAGLGAGIEVLRAEVEERSQRQRLIVAEQDAAAASASRWPRRSSPAASSSTRASSPRTSTSTAPRRAPFSMSCVRRSWPGGPTSPRPPSRPGPPPSASSSATRPCCRSPMSSA
jgi:outer membrane protein TolC